MPDWQISTSIHFIQKEVCQIALTSTEYSLYGIKRACVCVSIWFNLIIRKTSWKLKTWKGSEPKSQPKKPVCVLFFLNFRVVSNKNSKTKLKVSHLFHYATSPKQPSSLFLPIQVESEKCFYSSLHESLTSLMLLGWVIVPVKRDKESWLTKNVSRVLNVLRLARDPGVVKTTTPANNETITVWYIKCPSWYWCGLAFFSTKCHRQS